MADKEYIERPLYFNRIKPYINTGFKSINRSAKGWEKLCIAPGDGRNPKARSRSQYHLHQ